MRAAMVELGGYIDVTAEPFNADPTGRRDSTEAIRQAMAAAREQVKTNEARRRQIRNDEGGPAYNAGPVRPNATVYFPAGTYRVTGPLVLADNIPDSRLLHIVGEDRENTIIRLDDRSPGFGDVNNPQVLVNFLDFRWSNSAFCNSVEGITIDVGAGNPGAVALRYHNNNVGYVRDVTLRSSDPNRAGHTGLAMAQHLGGIALFQDIEIIGFNHGVRTASHHVNLTFERLTLRGQRRAGITNADKSMSIRHLISENRVPAIVNTTGAGQVVLVDSQLVGGSDDEPAIDNQAGQVVVRDVTVSGYGSTIRDRGEHAHKGDVDFYATDGAMALGDGVPAEPLRLPILETPDVPWDDRSDWAIVDGTTQIDDTTAIQAAIDSGARTVVLPQDHYLISDTIVFRGNVERIFGNWSMIHPLSSLGWQAKPMFRFVDQPGGPDTVVFEQFDTNWNYTPSVWWFQHDASRTLVIRDVIFGYGSGAYRNTGTGDLFLENVCHAGGGTMRSSPAWVFNDQRVWARGFNTEAYYPHVIADDSDVWILGYKVGEYHGPYFVVRNGSRLETLGGVFNSLVKGKQHKPGRALMAVDHAEASVTGVERSTQRQGQPHPVIATLVEGDAELVLNSIDAPKRGQSSVEQVYGAAMSLVRAGKAPAEGLPTLAIRPMVTEANVVTAGQPVASITIDGGTSRPSVIRMHARINEAEPVTFDIGVPPSGDSVDLVAPAELFDGMAGLARIELSVADRSDYRVTPGERSMAATIASERIDLDRGLISRLDFKAGRVTDELDANRRLAVTGVTSRRDSRLGDIGQFNSGGVQMAWPIDLSSPDAKRGSVHGIHFELQPYPPAEVFMHDRVFAKTVAAWVRPQQTKRPQLIFDRGKRQFGVAMRIADGHVEAGIGLMGQRFVVRERVRPGVWTHVAMTFNRGRVRLYVNGEEAGTVAATPGYRGFEHIDYQDSAGGWGRAWGGDVFSSPQPTALTGGLAHAVLYDRALTPAEVRALFESR
ncbi:MAG: glycosyl hydrolase family 28-related protein [Planctomycetota bacterium]